MSSRDEFEAARKAAMNCATASGWPLQIAAGKAELSPEVKREVDRLLGAERSDDDPPLASPAMTPIALPGAVSVLCNALASGWGVISKVEDDLIRVAAGPASAGGMTRPSAHRLAWDFARRLWMSIRQVGPRLDPQFDAVNVDPSQFDLDEGLIRANHDAVITTLAGRPLFDADRVKALIIHESVRAIDVLESARTKATSNEFPDVINPSQMKHQLEQKEIEFARTEPLPNPETLTVDEMIKLITFVDRTGQMIGIHPVIYIQWSRRSDVLNKSFAFQEFMEWNDLDFHRGTRIEAAHEFLARLVDRLRRPSKEIRPMLLSDAVQLINQRKDAPAIISEHHSGQVESTPGQKTDSRIDLTPIISAARDVRETLRHHTELVSAPGYDVTLGLHRISLAIGNASQLFPTRNEDSEAVDFCNVLSTCMDRLMENLLAEKSWDADAVKGLEKAITALESLRGRREGKQEPRYSDPIATPRIEARLDSPSIANVNQVDGVIVTPGFANAAHPHRSGSRSETKRKRHKRGEPSLKILAALRSLADEGKWNVAETDIRTRAGVSRSTYYAVLNRDEAVKNAMDEYHARRLGRGPVRPDEL
jgi:hypothetical protein